MDRAYVVTGEDKLEVLFARGEVGSFGKRSKSYRSYLSCGVRSSDPMRIYFLLSPMQDPLIHLREVESISANPMPGFRESLYLRTDSGFRFVDEQPYDPDKIETEPTTEVQ